MLAVALSSFITLGAQKLGNSRYSKRKFLQSAVLQKMLLNLCNAEAINISGLLKMMQGNLEPQKLGVTYHIVQSHGLVDQISDPGYA